MAGQDASDATKAAAAERFIAWLEGRVLAEARGDDSSASSVDPLGLFWLGRLGPKDQVTKTDGRGDRLEPCAIGLRIRPEEGATECKVTVRCCGWIRQPRGSGRAWAKSDYVQTTLPVSVPSSGEMTFGVAELDTALSSVGLTGVQAEVRLLRGPRGELDVSFVNTTTADLPSLCEGRLFECRLEVSELKTAPVELEALPDSFRYDRRVDAFGLNCGAVLDRSTGSISTTDGPAVDRPRPTYWSQSSDEPELTFANLASDPLPACRELVEALERWGNIEWSEERLAQRAVAEGWSRRMSAEASDARRKFEEELDRLATGLSLLRDDAELLRAFKGMNRAMGMAAAGKYDRWRPFQLGFLLANLRCLVSPEDEAGIVDVVWFATGGGKTETYLGLLVTAALLDRMKGKASGVTAWSRFPLRMLSLQQTQRFANALGAAELVRLEEGLAGDPFSLGFLVGGSATPNRIVKDARKDSDDWDPIRLEDHANPFRLIDECPFCRENNVTTAFDRRLWRLNHQCQNAACAWEGKPLPIYVVDDEIWRFLPTVVVGTLDKAANIARQPAMRGMVGPPWGCCSIPGHGYTYAPRADRPHGCLVPDCTGQRRAPEMAPELFAPRFRLQDELHLLRDSLGAVDAHYEAALDSIQAEVGGSIAKVLASSATLSGYEKQVEVLYQREARVFPQPPPLEGDGFWSASTGKTMRRFVALAPRGLTIEFAVDRLVVTLQRAIRRLLTEPDQVCSEAGVPVELAGFLLSIYGTDVVYGNTLRDLDAVIRSSETQYVGIEGRLGRAYLTGRTDFEEVRETLGRLERPEERFEDRIHLVAASSMMSHGVDIDRLNVMVMLGLPLGVAEFIQATARVGRRWPALVFVMHKIGRERDASVYRNFPQFVSHGDRFVEPIPITRNSRRVLERTAAGLELSRIHLVREPEHGKALTTIRAVNDWRKRLPGGLAEDENAIAAALELTERDPLLRDDLERWFANFTRNLENPPTDARFVSDASPTGSAMLSLRDVEEQAPVKGDSSR